MDAAEKQVFFIPAFCFGVGRFKFPDGIVIKAVLNAQQFAFVMNPGRTYGVRDRHGEVGQIDENL